jgi:predicted nucleic acid-binding Zn ribbon protein
VSFQDAVEDLLDARGWQAESAAAAVLARWDVLVGPEIAGRCRPVGLRDGDLTVVAESTAWATQLRMLSRQLLARLRGELGAGVVTRLTVRGPTAPSWGHGRLRAPGGRGPRDTYG